MERERESPTSTTEPAPPAVTPTAATPAALTAGPTTAAVAPPPVRPTRPTVGVAPRARALTGYHARLDTVGPYHIVGLLGEGGMGTVYLAEQEVPVRREVALKLLRPAIARAEVLARFETERQALAMMEHPNITRVYDAGVTETGEPYFVMERVHGVPITAYADGQALTVAERVRIFAQVCAAVQHAHQKGIIHRDLKPSNVLVAEVDGAPHCKVIDFGVAKAVTPEADDPQLTATGIAVGTPAYMSPEQFSGGLRDVDTRSDVYALGVLLYELLAGVRPYDEVGIALASRHAAGEVPAPSARFAGLPLEDRTLRARARGTDAATLRATLAGDLDAVLLKALERDRERRYATASDLAQDLGRYLRHEPVTATQGTGAYRLRKFVRRHRGSVVFTSTLLALLVTFAVTSAVQARRLARAERTAVTRQAQAERLVGFMLGDLRSRLTPLGRTDVLDAVGDRALAYFAAVPESELSGEELYRRGEALQQIGQVRLDQGRLPEAARLFRAAVAADERLAARGSPAPEWQLGLAHAHFWAGNVEWSQGNVDAALAHWMPFVEASERLVTQYPDSASFRRELAYALGNIGSAREARGDLPGALAAFRQVLAVRSALLRREPTATRALRDLAMAHDKVGVAERKVGHLAAAIGNHEAEVALASEVAAANPTDAEAQRDLANAHSFLATARLARGDVDGAVADTRAAQAVVARLAARDAANTTWQADVAGADNSMAQLLVLRGDAPAALRTVDAALSRLDALVARATPGERLPRALVVAHTTRARALARDGRTGDARAAARTAVDLGERAVARRPSDLDHRRVAADAYLALGDVLAHSGDVDGALAARTRALALVDSVARVTAQTELLAMRASALLDLGRTADARPTVAELARRGYRHPAYAVRAGVAGDR